MNLGTDTSELLGGFEQTSHDIILSKLKNEVLHLISQDLQLPNLEMETQLKLMKWKLKLNSSSDLESLAKILEEYKIFNSNVQPILEALVHDLKSNKLSFEWIDSILVNAIQQGDWVVLSDANLCNPSVLDRLNSLMEENGSLAIGEKGCHHGKVPHVKPHPNFRLFLTMDPRDGELSPAMRNRGVEIFVHEHKTNQDYIIGNELIRYGRAFINSRQFELTKNYFGPSMGHRALIAFFSLAQDWKAKEYLSQIHFGSQFQHPCNKYLESTQNINEFQLLVHLEMDSMKRCLKEMNIPKKEFCKRVGQGLNQFVQDLTNLEWSTINFVANGIREMADDLTNQDTLAIIWEVLRLKTPNNESKTVLDELLLLPINKYEPFALKFTEKYFQSAIPRHMPNYNSDLFTIKHLNELKEKPLDGAALVLKSLLEQDVSFQNADDLKIVKSVLKFSSIDNIIQLISIDLESSSQNYDNFVTINRYIQSKIQKVTIKECKEIKNSLDEIFKILENRKCDYTEKIQNHSRRISEFSQNVLTKCHKSLQFDLPVSETVKKVISR